MRHVPSSQADGYVSLASRVHAEVAAVLDLMAYDVTPDSDLRAHYGVSDRDRLLLRVAIEKGFGVFVPIAHVQQWRTVGDITTYVEGRLGSDRIAG